MASASLSLHPSLICTCSSARNTLVATSFSSFYTPSLSSVVFFFKRTRWSSRHSPIRSMAPDLLGDFGARDPFPAELESNFGEKVLGNESTEHRILIPNLSVISLAQRSCEPVPSSQLPLSKEDAEKLLKKALLLSASMLAFRCFAVDTAKLRVCGVHLCCLLLSCLLEKLALFLYRLALAFQLPDSISSSAALPNQFGFNNPQILMPAMRGFNNQNAVLGTLLAQHQLMQGLQNNFMGALLQQGIMPQFNGQQLNLLGALQSPNFMSLQQAGLLGRPPMGQNMNQMMGFSPNGLLCSQNPIFPPNSRLPLINSGNSNPGFLGNDNTHVGQSLSSSTGLETQIANQTLQKPILPSPLQDNKSNERQWPQKKISLKFSSTALGSKESIGIQQLKEVLAKQAELGVEVAEIPSIYLTEPEDQASKNVNVSEALNTNIETKCKLSTSKKRGRFRSNKRNAKRLKFRNEAALSHEPVVKRREPTLLRKLLNGDIRHDKCQLLQAFRFMVLNTFFNGVPDKPLLFPIVTTKDGVLEPEVFLEKKPFQDRIDSEANLLAKNGSDEEVETAKYSTVVGAVKGECDEDNDFDDASDVVCETIGEDFILHDGDKSEEGEITN
ncbi:hypothetical protein MA16_Dca022556 [Dendrobium catenatum]|uniref:Uncharacterized protein n=1 Tax=Dendrobium catenatum TaxID=906689 RepID=A0A2I0VEE1_9ASPA|nr:hypothetical protein MA16_Dca022556 [Dendrobium catenatum]